MVFTMSMWASITFGLESSNAQWAAKQYSKVNGWAVYSESERGQFVGCYAEKRSAYAHAGNGSLLRVGYGPRGVYIGTDFGHNSGDFQTNIDIDGRYYDALFRTNSDGWAIAEINLPLENALHAGNTIVLNLEPQGPEFSLSGSSAAMDQTVQCSHQQGYKVATISRPTTPTKPPAASPSALTRPLVPSTQPSRPSVPQANTQNTVPTQSAPHEWINADEWSVAGYRFKGPRNRKTAQCKVDYRNQTIASGSCTFESRDRRGSFEVFVGGVQAKVYVYEPGEGDGSDAIGALKGPGFGRFAATGALYRNGACWGNRTNRICAW